MKRNTGKVWGIALLVAATASLTIAGTTSAAGGPQGAVGRREAAVVSDELSDEEQEALTEFLLDEHKALATYASVMADFGAVQPFVSIARAEEQHIAALERVFERYGVPLPTVPQFDIEPFASPEEACAAGVDAEIANAGLYDQLLSVIDHADVARVAQNLQAASLNNHLPAFEACGEAEDAPGTVAGRAGNAVAAGGPGSRRLAAAGSRGARQAPRPPRIAAYRDRAPIAVRWAPARAPHRPTHAAGGDRDPAERYRRCFAGRPHRSRG